MLWHRAILYHTTSDIRSFCIHLRWSKAPHWHGPAALPRNKSPKDLPSYIVWSSRGHGVTNAFKLHLHGTRPRRSCTVGFLLDFTRTNNCRRVLTGSSRCVFMRPNGSKHRGCFCCVSSEASREQERRRIEIVLPSSWEFAHACQCQIMMAAVSGMTVVHAS
jgi:hypothetical protein